MKIIITENQLKTLVSDVTEDLSQYKEGNLKVLYRDGIVTVVVPVSPKASEVTCRGTEWCSKDPKMFDHWGKNNILFRFLFKDGYKLRLTWEFNIDSWEGEYRFSWGSGGQKYYEINGHGNPFDGTDRMEKDIVRDYKKLLKNPNYKPEYVFFDWDIKRETTGKEYYENVRNVKLEIVKRIKMISPQVINVVNEYRDNILKQNENNNN